MRSPGRAHAAPRRGAPLGVASSVQQLRPKTTMMMRTMAALAVVVVVVCATDGVHAAIMTLEREASTVAGNDSDAAGDVDGLPGVSRISSPHAMCASYNASSEVVLVSSNNRMRTLNTSNNFLGTWANVNLSGAACAAVTVTNDAGTRRAVFYVQCANVAASTPRIVRITADGIVTPFDLSISGSQVSLHAIAYYDSALYVLSNEAKLYTCSVSITTTASGDTSFSVSTVCTLVWTMANLDIGDGVAAVAVSREYTVVSVQNQAYVFNTTGTLPRTSIQLGIPQPLVDVHYRARERLFIAASTSAVYHVQITPPPATTPTAGPSITTTRIAGSSNTNCFLRTDNTNGRGANITFCGIKRLHALTADTIYVSITGMYLVRALTLPPVRVNTTLARPPWPVDFVNASLIMPRVYASATAELNGLLGIDMATTLSEAQAHINTSATVVVNDVSDGGGDGDAAGGRWGTFVQVTVPQRNFDTSTTAATIAAFAFPKTREVVDAYYNLIDVALYGDRNVLPLCNRTRMRALERQTAMWARAVLAYQHIYLAPLTILPPSPSSSNDNSGNVTRVKLLLPVTFGAREVSYNDNTGVITVAGRNATTDNLLSAANYSAFLVRTITDSYDANHTYNLTFHGAQVNFDALSASQQQELRWRVYDVATARLKWCEQQANSNSGGGGGTDASSSSSSSVVPGCTPTPGITNMTRVLLLGTAEPDYVFGFFVPEGLHYNYDLARCLGGIDWSSIIDWANNRTAPPPRGARGCDTGCIVGVAVAAAVVAVLLVVVAVVLLSKRRRLAVVLAPPPQHALSSSSLSSSLVGRTAAVVKEPEFASTVDMEEVSHNPLRVPW